MRTDLFNANPEHQDMLGAEARAVIEADFKEIPSSSAQKPLATRLKDALGQLVNNGQKP